MEVIWIYLFAALIMCGNGIKVYTNLNQGTHTYGNMEKSKSVGFFTEWTGRYFPGNGSDTGNKGNTHESKMYEFDPSCDDGRTNLTVDWDSSPINFTCFYSGRYFKPDFDVKPIIKHNMVPPAHHAIHKCMKEEIFYETALTTFGTHRPAWARYGEYKFIPKQRWLHNAEHGAVIMLYHPCAHPTFITQLRSLVTSCLNRYIITPFNLLTQERPLALLTWGWYLSMNTVNSKLVTKFIKEHALTAPEDISRDGPYDYLLIRPANTNEKDSKSTVCSKLSSSAQLF